MGHGREDEDAESSSANIKEDLSRILKIIREDLEDRPVLRRNLLAEIDDRFKKNGLSNIPYAESYMKLLKYALNKDAAPEEVQQNPVFNNKAFWDQVPADIKKQLPQELQMKSSDAKYDTASPPSNRVTQQDTKILDEKMLKNLLEKLIDHNFKTPENTGQEEISATMSEYRIKNLIDIQKTNGVLVLKIKEGLENTLPSEKEAAQILIRTINTELKAGRFDPSQWQVALNSAVNETITKEDETLKSELEHYRDNIQFQITQDAATTPIGLEQNINLHRRAVEIAGKYNNLPTNNLRNIVRNPPDKMFEVPKIDFSHIDKFKFKVRTNLNKMIISASTEFDNNKNNLDNVMKPGKIADHKAAYKQLIDAQKKTIEFLSQRKEYHEQITSRWKNNPKIKAVSNLYKSISNFTDSLKNTRTAIQAINIAVEDVNQAQNKLIGLTHELNKKQSSLNVNKYIEQSIKIINEISKKYPPSNDLSVASQLSNFHAGQFITKELKYLITTQQRNIESIKLSDPNIQSSIKARQELPIDALAAVQALIDSVKDNKINGLDQTLADLQQALTQKTKSLLKEQRGLDTLSNDLSILKSDITRELGSTYKTKEDVQQNHNRVIKKYSELHSRYIKIAQAPQVNNSQEFARTLGETEGLLEKYNAHLSSMNQIVDISIALSKNHMAQLQASPAIELITKQGMSLETIINFKTDEIQATLLKDLGSQLNETKALINNTGSNIFPKVIQECRTSLVELQDSLSEKEYQIAERFRVIKELNEDLGKHSTQLLNLHSEFKKPQTPGTTGNKEDIAKLELITAELKKTLDLYKNTLQKITALPEKDLFNIKIREINNLIQELITSKNAVTPPTTPPTDDTASKLIHEKAQEILSFASDIRTFSPDELLANFAALMEAENKKISDLPPGEEKQNEADNYFENIQKPSFDINALADKIKNRDPKIIVESFNDYWANTLGNDLDKLPEDAGIRAKLILSYYPAIVNQNEVSPLLKSNKSPFPTEITNAINNVDSTIASREKDLKQYIINNSPKKPPPSTTLNDHLLKAQQELDVYANSKLGIITEGSLVTAHNFDNSIDYFMKTNIYDPFLASAKTILNNHLNLMSTETQEVKDSFTEAFKAHFKQCRGDFTSKLDQVTTLIVSELNTNLTELTMQIDLVNQSIITDLASKEAVILDLPATILDEIDDATDLFSLLQKNGIALPQAAIDKCNQAINENRKIKYILGEVDLVTIKLNTPSPIYEKSFFKSGKFEEIYQAIHTLISSPSADKDIVNLSGDKLANILIKAHRLESKDDIVNFLSTQFSPGHAPSEAQLNSINLLAETIVVRNAPLVKAKPGKLEPADVVTAAFATEPDKLIFANGLKGTLYSGANIPEDKLESIPGSLTVASASSPSKTNPAVCLTLDEVKADGTAYNESDRRFAGIAMFTKFCESCAEHSPGDKNYNPVMQLKGDWHIDTLKQVIACCQSTNRPFRFGDIRIDMGPGQAAVDIDLSRSRNPQDSLDKINNMAELSGLKEVISKPALENRAQVQVTIRNLNDKTGVYAGQVEGLDINKGSNLEIKSARTRIPVSPAPSLGSAGASPGAGVPFVEISTSSTPKKTGGGP